MMPAVTLPVVPIVQAGYLLMALCIAAGVAVLVWDSRSFMSSPVTPAGAHRKTYVQSLARGVWQLVSVLLAVIAAGLSFAVFAGAMG